MKQGLKVSEQASGERVSARASSTTVVFLHPIGLDSHCAQWLSVERMVAPTFPGHGERSRPRAGMTLDDMADEVVGWTEGPLHVVGALMGGDIALHLALSHPDRVRSLVLVASGARANRQALLARARSLEGPDDHVEDMLSRWFSSESLRAMPAEPGVAYARACLCRMDRASLAACWMALADHDVTDRLGEIRAPTTWIAGRRDVVHPPEEMELYARAMPCARVLGLEASHMVPLDDPSGLTGAVHEHLTWCSGRGAEEDT